MRVLMDMKKRKKIRKDKKTFQEIDGLSSDFIVSVPWPMVNRYLSRFFDCWAHKTRHAYIGNKHFFTKACHHQTYQNSKISWQKCQFLTFKVNFLCQKSSEAFYIFFHWRILISGHICCYWHFSITLIFKALYLVRLNTFFVS